MDMRRDKRVHESEHALSSTTAIGQQSAGHLYELVAQVVRCGSTKREITGSIPTDEIKS